MCLPPVVGKQMLAVAHDEAEPAREPAGLATATGSTAASSTAASSIAAGSTAAGGTAAEPIGGAAAVDVSVAAPAARCWVWVAGLDNGLESPMHELHMHLTYSLHMHIIHC